VLRPHGRNSGGRDSRSPDDAPGAGAGFGRRQRVRSHRDWRRGCEALGIDVQVTRTLRRRFAFACVDWSERRPHIGGALGAALLSAALKKKWVVPDLDSRALSITTAGRREMCARFGLQD
jgi:hypothetical protein